MHDNDIGVRPFKSHIIIGGTDVIHYDSKGVCDPMIRRTNLSLTLRSPPQQTVLLPGESLCLKTPPDVIPNAQWALEPRCDNSVEWFAPCEVKDTDREITLTSQSNELVKIRKNTHYCQI